MAIPLNYNTILYTLCFMKNQILLAQSLKINKTQVEYLQEEEDQQINCYNKNYYLKMKQDVKQ